MPIAPLPDVPIHFEEHGPADGEPLLLVMGLGTQLVYWPPGLIQRFTDAGLHVITFDNRDVGLSGRGSTQDSDMGRIVASSFGIPLPPPPYTLSDMAGDAVALLDHLGLRSAHVVGVSMGGMIAQRMALRHPSAVRSLTSIMSSTGDWLSRILIRPRALRTLLVRLPLDSRQAFIEAVMETRQSLRGSLPGDDDFLRQAVGESYDRGLNPAGFVRQLHATRADGDRTRALRHLDVPSLVIHGTEDPLVHVSSGVRTADAIPGSRLRLIEGMGHDMAPAAQEIIADEVLRLLKDGGA